MQVLSRVWVDLTGVKDSITESALDAKTREGLGHWVFVFDQPSLEAPGMRRTVPLSHHVIIAPSDIPNANMGLFTVTGLVPDPLSYFPEALPDG